MKQNNYSLPYVFVLGNEKGGAGKTTCSMHLVVGLLEEGFKVATIDVDCRQHSLTTYITNRKQYSDKHPGLGISMPHHFLLKESTKNNKDEKEAEEKEWFDTVFAKAKSVADVIVIDTPGSQTYLSRLAHSHADSIITPINDSFVDLDVLAKVSADKLDVTAPSIYSQLIWEQKMLKAQRSQGTIEWVILRNRLSHIDAVNKRRVGDVLEKFAKRFGARLLSGLSERVIYRELFLDGLTLHDLSKDTPEHGLKISHLAARQELRELFDAININQLKQKLENVSA